MADANDSRLNLGMPMALRGCGHPRAAKTRQLQLLGDPRHPLQ
jgi:hypothetical protein